MSRDDQIAFCLSMLDNIKALLLKIGKPSDSFEEPGIHAFMLKHKILTVSKTGFEWYKKHELQRAIAKLNLIHAQYQKQWWQACEHAADMRDSERHERDRILRDCMTTEQMNAYLRERSLGGLAVEWFTWEANIEGATYWRKKDRHQPYYTVRSAHQYFNDFFAHTGRPFQDFFETAREIGYDGTLFKPLFTLG